MHKKTVLAFIDSINAHDVDGITGFLSDDHVFIDAQDNEYTGKQRMGESWVEYFSLFPDYTIEVENVLERENMVAIFGYASATYKGLTAESANFWRLPAAWKGVVEKDKIKVWQVYADYALILDIIEKNK
jgi:ketosteroid isomerase-like protein